MQIKIYTKGYSALTSLIQSNDTSDFNALSYRSSLMQVGSAQFTMRLDNDKATMENLKHYNIVEFVEDDEVGTVRWTGVIVHRLVKYNTVTVTCYSMEHLLTKRLTPDADTYDTDAGSIASSLLSDTNTNEDTQIDAGTLDDYENVEITFSQISIFQALKNLASASGGQFIINPDRTLDFRAEIGEDKSDSVILQYRRGLIASANILKFRVEDDGKDIVSKTYGKTASLTSAQENTTISDEYGLLESFEYLSGIDSQSNLDDATSNNNQTSELSPRLDLSPDVPDTFEVGDTVKVMLKNQLVSIEDNFQVIEKDVRYKGGDDEDGQREISIRVNSIPNDFFNQMRKIKEDMELIKREV